jgi:purine-binding chemotaxis protein CheW
MPKQVLIVRAHDRAYAVPLAAIIETMRPRPMDPLAGVPPFVRGLAMIRGVPTPIVGLAELLGMPADVAGRWVALRAGARQVALAVESVIAIRDLAHDVLHALPPLLDSAAKETIDLLAVADAELLMVLRSGLALPDALWLAADGA